MRVVALVAALTPIGKLEEMVNIGTLAAFILVSIAVPILRKQAPRPASAPSGCRSARAADRCPPLICFYLMLNLSLETWIRFLIWMASASSSTSPTGYRNSRLHGRAKEGELPSMTST